MSLLQHERWSLSLCRGERMRIAVTSWSSLEVGCCPSAGMRVAAHTLPMMGPLSMGTPNVHWL